MKEKIKQNEGITLIALVITIIVLLILVGVTIASLTGENGLLERASSTNDATEKGKILDKVRIAIIDKIAEKQGQNLNETEIKDILDNYLDEDEVEAADLSELDTELKVNDGDYTITLRELLSGVTIVDLASKVEITVGGNPINGGTLAKTDEELKTSYGQDTNYTSENGVTWQLFYDDRDNIYLIAKNYVPLSTLTQATELIKEEGNPTQKYGAKFFNNSNNTYSGTILETEPWSNGCNSTTITSNPLTSSYLNWVRSATSFNYPKDNKNMKAVAYMMDTSKWSNFAGSTLGAYAIGGPTLEMFVKSYNACHSSQKLETYNNINTSNRNANGYMVKISGSGSWSHYIGNLQSSDDMWIPYFSDYGGYWLASPASYSNAKVCRVYEAGYINDDFSETDSYPFRPLVVIPKTSIK